MRESTALTIGLSVDELRARVAASREAQGLPATIDNPTTLQHIADLMRSASPPDAKRRRKRRAAS